MALLGCHHELPLPSLEPAGTYFKATINGTPYDDPQNVLNPPGSQRIIMVSTATQSVGADTATTVGLGGMYRTLRFDWSAYANRAAVPVGGMSVKLPTFNPGPVKLEYYHPEKILNRMPNYYAALVIADGVDIPTATATLDTTQAYHFTIDKYEPKEGFVEGRFAMTLRVVANVGSYLSKSDTIIRFTDASFRAKITKYNSKGEVVP